VISMKQGVIGLLTVAVLSIGGYFAFLRAQKPPPPSCSGDTPVFIPTNGGELLLGQVKRTQTFSTKYILTIAGIPMSACSSLSSITIPASTSYKVQLAKKWEVRIRDGELIVIAPRITPLLPVAFDTSGIKKNAAGCLLLSKQDTLDALELGISKQLKKYAESPQYLKLARESGRVVVTKFVRNWLVKQKQYERAAAFPIKVFFEGEPITYY